jgi:sugar (pentulose or hexulose) kinase
LVDQYRRHPEAVDKVLREQAMALKWVLDALLTVQQKGLPRFVEAGGARSTFY